MRLEARARALDLDGRVRFQGLSSRVPDVLRAADVFLLSSHGEGMSNALLEAMACGLPCLASRSIGGAAELLGEGRGVLLADGDVTAWAGAIERLAGDAALRGELGSAAAAFVARRLSLDAAADRLASAYAVVAKREP
jgi:glycosyltransferase involved in cell wall biosynthesis